MSAILVLLALLSVATLASRGGYAAFAAHIVTVPLLIAVGVILSPRALGVFTPQVTDALIPAMRVGASWLALLIGMRAVRPQWNRDYARSVGLLTLSSVVTWTLAGAAALGVLLASKEYEMGFADPTGNRLSAIGAAVLLGGLVTGSGLAFTREALEPLGDKMVCRVLLFISQHDDIVAAIAVCAAVWLWPISASMAPIYATPYVAVVVVIGLGFTLFLALLLTSGKGPEASGPQAMIGLLGLLVFASGLSTTAVLPGAAIAFFFGGFVASSAQAVPLLAQLQKTERPVTMVVLILVGTHLGFSIGALVVGVALAAARIAAKLAIRSIASGVAGEPIPHSAVFPSSRVAIPLALSFALSRPEPLAESEILTAVCTCVGLCDLITLILWRRTTSLEVGTKTSETGAIGEPTVDGAHAAPGAEGAT